MQSALYAAILRLNSIPHPDLALIAGIRSDISKATAKLGQAAEPPAAQDCRGERGLGSRMLDESPLSARS